LLTTLMRKLKFIAAREPIACLALALFLLTGATGAALTARQILTAAPSAVNLNSVAASEGTSTGMARADHTHSLSGTLPQTRGGTGAGALTCTAKQGITSDGTLYSCAQNFVALQGATPGTADTGNFNINGTGILRTLNIWDDTVGASSGTLVSQRNGSVMTQGLLLTATGGGTGGGAIAPMEFVVTSVPASNTPAMRFIGGGTTYFQLNPTNASGSNYPVQVVGISSLAPSTYPVRVMGPGSSIGTFYIDSSISMNTSSAQIQVSNNGTPIWQMFSDGSVTKACRFSLNTGSISPAAVAANTCQTTTITSSGLTAGKPCVASASSALTAGLIPFCEVTSATNVNYKICNVTVGAVTPPATTTYNACILGG
jgi:hypothetical protein